MKSARRFKTERFESLKSFSKHNGKKYYGESFPPVARKRCYVASLDLDFELNRSPDPLAKSGYKFIDILKALITKLEYSWNKQMNNTPSKLTNLTCFFFLLLFFELLNPVRDEYLSFTPSFPQFHHRKSIYLKHLHQE